MTFINLCFNVNSLWYFIIWLNEFIPSQMYRMFTNINHSSFTLLTTIHFPLRHFPHVFLSQILFLSKSPWTEEPGKFVGSQWVGHDGASNPTLLQLFQKFFFPNPLFSIVHTSFSGQMAFTFLDAVYLRASYSSYMQPLFLFYFLKPHKYEE